MKNFVLIGLVVVSVFTVTINVSAQSSDGSTGGTTPPSTDPTQPAVDPKGASTVSVPTTPAPVLAPASATAPTSPAIVKPKVVSPKPKIPTPTPVTPITAISNETVPPTTPTSNNSSIFVVVGAMVVGGVLGFFGLKAKKATGNGPCDAIKKQRDLKKGELEGVTNKFSIQKALMDKLKKEVENKKEKINKNLIKKTRNKTLETIGNETLTETVVLIEEGKKLYDGLVGKYEKGQKLLEILRQKQLKLAGELATLDSSYNQCMLQVTASNATLPGGINLEFFSGETVPKTTLLFLHKPKEKKILLAMKKRSFGKGKWNGVGGKLMKGETIHEALVRETKEEIAVLVEPTDLIQMATLDFAFKNNSEWNQQTHVFFTERWEGEPVETEEMDPKWHSIDELPFENMWIDDPHWLPLVLEGKKVNASFIFDNKGDEILDMKIDQNS